jgi:hypothetical protein
VDDGGMSAGRDDDNDVYCPHCGQLIGSWQ